MTLLSLFALVLRAALVAPKASKRETQLADQREREIQQNMRLIETAGRSERSKRKARLARARDKAWRQTERLSPIEQTLTVQPICPATALALPRDWRVCSPSRAQVMTNRR